jgi:hypothetical protein
VRRLLENASRLPQDYKTKEGWSSNLLQVRRTALQECQLALVATSSTAERLGHSAPGCSGIATVAERHFACRHYVLFDAVVPIALPRGRLSTMLCLPLF